MTSRLIAMGHERIGFTTGTANQTASALRRDGYERAMLPMAEKRTSIANCTSR